MTTFDSAPALAKAAEAWRAGSHSAAREELSRAIQVAPNEPDMLAMAGLFACQDGDLVAGADFLRRALMLRPDDQAARINLATALISLGDLDEADAVLADADQTNVRALRLAAFVAAERRHPDQAASLYEELLRHTPDDVQSLNNLGNAYVALGRRPDAVRAFERAVQLAAFDPMLHVNGAKALTSADAEQARLQWTERAVTLLPHHADIQIERGLALAAAQRFAEAERAFRAAIAAESARAEPYVELGLLLENLNRIDDLDTLVRDAIESGVAPTDVAILAAWLARRRGQWAAAAAEAATIGEEVTPIRRHHILADIADRTGDVDSAFNHFSLMNDAAAATIAPFESQSYLEEVADSTRRNLAALVLRERVAEPVAPIAPIFIVGFPRSGTTLLDTLLMNNPRFHVLEELPVLPTVEAEANRTGGVVAADPDSMRRRYAELLAQISPAPAGSVVVDKFPLHSARLPLIYRTFPDARVIFVERHPMDVVLSCFMANFQMNRAMRHFTTLRGATELYDEVLKNFTQGAELLPLQIHRLRYERLVSDVEAEMRALMEFLGEPWDSKIVRNQESALRRQHIKTASYSQVTEPIYSRAVERWRQYEPYMAEVRPLLEPWCHAMGYDA